MPVWTHISRIYDFDKKLKQWIPLKGRTRTVQRRGETNEQFAARQEKFYKLQELYTNPTRVRT